MMEQDRGLPREACRTVKEDKKTNLDLKRMHKMGVN